MPPSELSEKEGPGGGWDIYQIALQDDPYSSWQRIREDSPVLSKGDGVFFVSRWDLVDTVLRDPRHLAGTGVSASFGASEGLAADAMRAWLMSIDGAEQTRARGLVRRSFTPRQTAELENFVRSTARALISELTGLAQESSADLVSGLAFPLPSSVIRSLFGVDRDEWHEEVEAVLRAPQRAEDGGIGMIEALAQYFERRLSRDEIPSGLLSQLRRSDPEFGELTSLEVIANAVLLVTAAIDTTAGLIGNCLRCVIDRPSLQAHLRRETGSIGDAVEETLRFEPPALSCSRTAGFTLELAGVTVPAGSALLLGIGAANRDPGRYPDPDHFSLDRDRSNLLSFGGGRHFCLGATLARMEARVALEQFLEASPLPWEAVEAPQWQAQNPTIRAQERLLVRSREEGQSS
ncbi:MAG: cytochrome P450 [Myxococcota bacterium]